MGPSRRRGQDTEKRQLRPLGVQEGRHFLPLFKRVKRGSSRESLVSWGVNARRKRKRSHDAAQRRSAAASVSQLQQQQSLKKEVWNNSLTSEEKVVSSLKESSDTVTRWSVNRRESQENLVVQPLCHSRTGLDVNFKSWNFLIEERAGNEVKWNKKIDL